MCMMHLHNHDDQRGQTCAVRDWLFSRAGIVTICMLAILGFLIYEGHGAHLLGLAPYLLILVCPLMHIFMHHGGHDNHHHHEEGNTQNANENKKHDGGCH